MTPESLREILVCFSIAVGIRRRIDAAVRRAGLPRVEDLLDAEGRLLGVAQLAATQGWWIDTARATETFGDHGGRPMVGPRSPNSQA